MDFSDTVTLTFARLRQAAAWAKTYAHHYVTQRKTQYEHIELDELMELR